MGELEFRIECGDGDSDTVWNKRGERDIANSGRRRWYRARPANHPSVIDYYPDRDRIPHRWANNSHIQRGNHHIHGAAGDVLGRQRERVWHFELTTDMKHANHAKSGWTATL